MTDHNIFLPHSELPPEELLLLTGVERDLEYGCDKCTHTGEKSPQPAGVFQSEQSGLLQEQRLLA